MEIPVLDRRRVTSGYRIGKPNPALTDVQVHDTIFM